VTTAVATRRTWRERLHLRRLVDPDKLFLRSYKLTKAQRIEMLGRGVLFTNFAIPIGSAIYFLFTQVKYQTQYRSTTMTLLYLKDTWDRLPIHLRNLVGAHWWGDTQAEPTWWVVARHDFRHVLIGVIAVLLVGGFGIGLKPRKARGVGQMLISIPLAFLAASVVAGALIYLFAQHQVAEAFDHVSAGSGVPYVQDVIGKGVIQLTVIGVFAGLAARKVLARTFYTLQGMSIDRNIAQGESLTGWKRVVYPATYRNRFHMTEALRDRGKHEVQLGSAWLGVTISLITPIMLFLLGYGVYLLYFGPASHAH
jgi:hypothetical protein